MGQCVIFDLMCQAHHIPKPVAELKFCETRRWKFDWAWPAAMLAVEIEGGVYTQGRHTRGSGFINDCYKYNMATLLGWRLLRFTPQQIKSGEAFPIIKQALGIA